MSKQLLTTKLEQYIIIIIIIITALNKAPFPGSYKAPYKKEGTNKCNENK